jgi:RHS repeat-associated protein
MTDWVNGAQPFYGFAVRASDTASSGWKRFRSKSYDDNPSQRPYVEVTYVAGVAGISAISPAPHGTVHSLTPTVWADLVDPVGTGTRRYEYKMCLGDDPDAPGPCEHSGAAWLTNPTWQVPTGDAVKWGQKSHWWVQVSNGLTNSGWLGPYFFDAVLAQPPVTSHLAGAPEGADLPGVNPQVGNYATAVTDAQVAVAGPALRVTRTYNSQDPRSDGAFGPGWSSPLDQKLVTEVDEDGDAAGYVVVTLASGREVRFGRNNDGSYTAPSGMNLTLTESASAWTLRDRSGTQTIFDDDGRLRQIRDVDGRTQHYTWIGSQLTKVTDAASGRSLHLTWTAGRVTQVATDVPAAGQSAPTWTYTYSSGKLTGVCTPLGGSACTTYGYGSGSHYRSVVLDDNPAGYWPLGETSGTTARNVAARKANEYDGTYTSVTLGASGALAGSPDTAVTFSTGSSRRVALPEGLVNSSMTPTVELWFKASSGQSGVLFGVQSDPATTVPGGEWTPTLYVGTDGKLRGEFWGWDWSHAPAPIVTTGTVTNGQWHHVVLTAAVDNQQLYLDGTLVQSTSLDAVNFLSMKHAQIGTGYTRWWPASNGDYMPFTGQIDEVAYYRQPLVASQVAAHYAARTATNRLTTITEPGPFTATTLTYDGNTGRVATVADRHGATWTLAAPSLTEELRAVTLSSTAGSPITYTYDARHNGRLVSRQDTFGTRAWSYGDNGFVDEIADELGNLTQQATDDRGNVTARTTCRDPQATEGASCHTEYFGYYLNSADPLDPRNDVLIRSADARSATATDPTYATTRTIDSAGRVTQITYPKPASQSSNPVEAYTYTNPTAAYTQSTATRSFIPANTTVLSISGDEGVATVTLPFPVPLFGTPVSSLRVSANGFLASAEDGSEEWINTTIPTFDAPNGGIYPFWDDLYLDGSSTVRTATIGTAPNRQFVIEWRNIRATSTDVFSMEAVLAENGEISFNYANLDSNRERGDSATVGIEDTFGTQALTYSYNQPNLTAGTAVIYTPNPAYATAPPAGLLASHTARNGGVTTHTYNASGDRLTTTDPVGLVATNTYDAIGRVYTTNRSKGSGGSYVNFGTTSMTYNGLGLPLTVTEPAITNPVSGVAHRQVTTFTYNSRGRPLTMALSDAVGGDPARTTTLAYDPAGRLISTTAPDTTVITQEWDTSGDVWRATKPGGLVLEYVYDDAHRLLTTTATGSGVDPMNPSATSLALETRSYDPAGRLAEVVDAMGNHTEYDYFGDNLVQELTATDRPGGKPDLALEQYVYDAAGQPTTVTRAGGRVTAFTYDPARNVQSQAVDPAGVNRVTSHSYNADSSIHHSTATGAGSPGRTERIDYTYDAAGRQLTTTTTNTGGSPASITSTVVRDARGLVTRETDPTGVATDHVYDLAGQLASSTGAARTVWVNGTSTSGVSPTATVGRNTYGDATHLRDANLNTTTSAYDAMGRPTSVTLPGYTPPGGSAITATTTAGYNAMGLPQTVTNALGHVTSITYDKYGRVLSVTQPDPDGAGSKTAPVTTSSYSRTGQLLSEVDATGAIASATYDELGRQVTATESERPGGGSPIYFTTELSYNDAGDLTTVETPLGHTTNTTYNGAAEPLRVTDPTGRFAQNTYDLAGRVVATVTGQNTTYNNPVATATFDLAGRQTQTAECTATGTGTCGTVLRTRTFSYDAASRPLQTTSAVGRPTFYGYDTAGQLATVTQRVDPAVSGTAVSIGLGYDKVGNKTRLLDGNSKATTYAYTPWGLPESVIEPSTPTHSAAADRTWTTVYNAVGWATEQRLPGNVTRTSTYDNLGRLTGETGTGAATTARALDYDPVGRLTSAASPAGNHTYTWTDRGLLSSATGYGGTATYTWDSDARLANRVDTTGTATFGYDNAGRLTSIIDPLTGVTQTNTHDTAGRLAASDYGAGTATRTYTYDNLGRLATDTLRRPDTSVSASASYSYDLDDLITQETTTGPVGAGANFYTYDGMGRVATWLSPGGTTTTYGYDAASNRTSVTTPAGTRTSTFDARNRIQGTTGAGGPADSYTWNARGALTTAVENGQTTSYTFDAFERLTAVTRTGGLNVTYGYDSLDRAAQRGAANFGYNSLSNTPVIAPTGAGEAKLLRDPSGTALSSKTGANPGRALLDDPTHGDITATLNPTTGNLDASTSYDPWGKPTASSGSLPAGYQGGYTDADLGFVNAHARWYQPNIGTFTSRDTWTLEPVPLPQANRYLYANGAPTRYRDLDGHRITVDSDSTQVWDPVKKQVRQIAPKPNPKPATPSSDCNPMYRSHCGYDPSMTKPTSTPVAPSPTDSNWWDDFKQWLISTAKSHRDSNGDGMTTTGDVAVTLVGCNQVQYQIACNVAGGRDNVFEVGELAGDVSGLNDYVRCFQGDEVSCAWVAASVVGGGLLSVALKAAGRALKAAIKGLTTAQKHVDNIPVTGGGGRPGPTPTTGGGTTPAPAAMPTPTRPVAPAPSVKPTVHEPTVPVGCRHSFAAGTAVLLADGSAKAIESINLGDEVASHDPITGETADQPVTALHTNNDTDLTDLVVVDETGDQHTIETTQHHPFWDATTGDWVDAGDLTAGHTLATADPETDTTTVQSVANRTAAARMYDLTVADIHTYYVLAGSTPVLVHNCGGEVPGHSANCACATGGTPRIPPNPNGRTGSPAHQNLAGQVAQDLRDQGFTVRTEVYIETPGGFKPYRFADVVAYGPDGRMVSVHQVGRQTGGGIPVMRETKAMSDIWSMLDDGVSILFHPYN